MTARPSPLQNNTVVHNDTGSLGKDSYTTHRNLTHWKLLVFDRQVVTSTLRVIPKAHVSLVHKSDIIQRTYTNNVKAGRHFGSY